MAKSVKAAPAKAARKTPVARPSLKMIEFTPGTIADALTHAGARKVAGAYMVPLEGITTIPGFNVRVTDTDEYREGIAGLARSMKAEGFYPTQPLGCFPCQLDGVTVLGLISGHRRYEGAVKAVAEGADFVEVPVTLKKPGSSDMDLAVSLYKENTGVPPTMLERAVLARRMQRSGLDPAEIAIRLDVTPRHVLDLSVLMDMPKEVRDLIKNNKIGAYEAIKQMRLPGGLQKILDAAEKAEKNAADKGAAKPEKLTKGKLDGDGATKLKTTNLNFAVKAGDEFLYEDAQPFIDLLGDDDWFKNAKGKTKRIALVDLSIEVKIRRPKSTTELAADAEAAQRKVDERKTASKKVGTKATTGKAPAAGAVETDPLEDELGLDDDGAEEAPDLRALGIADRVDHADL